MDRGHAELEIVKELTELYSEAHAEMLDEVEKALVSKKLLSWMVATCGLHARLAVWEIVGGNHPRNFIRFRADTSGAAMALTYRIATKEMIEQWP